MMDIVLGLEQEDKRMSWWLLRALRYRFGRNTEKLAPGDLYLAMGGDAGARHRPTARLCRFLPRRQRS